MNNAADVEYDVKHDLLGSRRLDSIPSLFIHSFIHSFGLNNKVQDIKVTKTLTHDLGLNTRQQHDIVR